MSSVRLHKASVVGHHNHLVAVYGNLDRVLKPRIEEVEHEVLLAIRLNHLGSKDPVSTLASEASEVQVMRLTS